MMKAATFVLLLCTVTLNATVSARDLAGDDARAVHMMCVAMFNRCKSDNVDDLHKHSGYCEGCMYATSPSSRCTMRR